MQKADEYTICGIGIPSMVLMERAALKTVAILESEQVNLDKTLIVCGSGNNGGDGFAIARLLKEKGHEVKVAFIGRETSMSEDCRQQLKIAEKCGVSIVTSINPKEYTSVVDAVFGVGLNREVKGIYRENIEKMNHLPGQKIAVDIPSGICASTGEVLGTAFLAELTVTFECEKLGCILFPGSIYAGKTVVVDIGINTKLFENESSVCYTFDREDLQALLPARKPDSHKGTYGKVLMITGSPGMAGAACLSAKAAYITGAGLVQIYTAEENRSVLQQLLPEAIISTYTEYDEEALHRLLEWADVVCLGCGLGRTDVSEKLVAETVRLSKRPCVADADALYVLGRHPELLNKSQQSFVLTPHMKEMTGLLGCTIRELQEKRFEIIRKFTDQYNVVCVLKDARTLVSKQGRRIFVNTAGNSSMAKAGSGDVLAGVITGLMAQGLDGYEAAVCGVYLHACGGDEAKKLKGSYSTLAADLITGVQTCIKNTEENMAQ